MRGNQNAISANEYWGIEWANHIKFAPNKNKHNDDLE